METNRPTKYIRIHTAQAGLGAPIVDAFQTGIGVLKTVEKGMKAYETDAKGQNAFDKQIQPTKDYAVEDLKTRALFESRGLGPRYEEFESKLLNLKGDEEQQKIAMRFEIPRLLNAISQGAAESMAPIDAIFDIATRIYFQTPDVGLVETTLKKLGEFEAKSPGISFWEDALKASNKENYSNVYNLKKMALIGLNAAKDFGDFRDLDIAIGYAHSPGSELDQEMMKQMRSDQAAKRSMETSEIIKARMTSYYKKRQNNINQMVNKWFQDNAQKIKDSALYDTWMKILMGIGVVSTAKNLALSVVNPAASTGYPTSAASSRGAASQKNFTRVAQAPQDLRPGVGVSPTASTGASSSAGVSPAAGATAAAGATGSSANAQDPNKKTDEAALKEALDKIEAYQKVLKLQRQYQNFKANLKSLKDAISSSLYQDDSGSLSSNVLGGNQVPMANAEKIIGLSLQAKNIIGQLFQLSGPIAQAIDALQSDPDYIELIRTNRAGETTDAGISNFKYQAILEQEADRNYLIVLEENINLAPLMTQINVLSVAESELKATYEAAKKDNPSAALPAAEQYRAVLNQVSELFYQLAMGYAQMYNAASMDEMKQVFALKARLNLARSQAKSGEAIGVRNEAYFGTKSASSAPYLFERTAEKVEKDLEREADARIRQYFDNLFNDTPGSPDVGTVLDNPAPYRGVLTTDVGKARKYRRHRSRPAHKA